MGRHTSSRWLGQRNYSGAGDAVGDVGSAADDGVGELSAAGSTAMPDIFDLDGLCFSSPACLRAFRSCVSLSFSAFAELRRAGSPISAFICAISCITSCGWASGGATSVSAVDFSRSANAFTLADSVFSFSSKAFILLSSAWSRASSSAFCWPSCCSADESCLWHAQMMIVREVRIDEITAFFISGLIDNDLA